MYENILKLEKMYNNADMKTIKNNLFKIKQEKRILYRTNCKRNNIKIETFRLFKDLEFSGEKEHSIVTKKHPSKISFIDVIRICNFLNIPLENLIKEEL